MTSLIEIVLGLLIGGAGFARIAENPLEGSCALLLAGFLIIIGFEKKLYGRAVESEIKSN